MRLTDSVTVLRPSATDAYGNPSASWDAPDTTVIPGFWTGSVVFVATGADVRQGDRLVAHGFTFDVLERPSIARSPSRDILQIVKVRRLGT